MVVYFPCQNKTEGLFKVSFNVINWYYAVLGMGNQESSFASDNVTKLVILIRKKINFRDEMYTALYSKYHKKDRI